MKTITRVYDSYSQARPGRGRSRSGRCRLARHQHHRQPLCLRGERASRGAVRRRRRCGHWRGPRRHGGSSCRPRHDRHSGSRPGGRGGCAGSDGGRCGGRRRDWRCGGRPRGVGRSGVRGAGLLRGGAPRRHHGERADVARPTSRACCASWTSIGPSITSPARPITGRPAGRGSIPRPTPTRQARPRSNACAGPTRPKL